MKICSLSARNFRTLENFDLSLKPNYCAISGKNNAGKSGVVKIIQHFFDDSEDGRYDPFYSGLTFQKDRTQWAANADSFEIAVTVELSREDDSEVFFVVETFSTKKIDGEKSIVKLMHRFLKTEQSTISCIVDGVELDSHQSSEILKKFRSASNLVVHNSTSPNRHFYFARNGFMEVLDSNFTVEDRKKIDDAEKSLQGRVRHAAKQHKEELEKLLGRLTEKYQVELTTIDRGRSSSFPLEIRLTDRSVEVPLTGWGAGTQNRTRILMSVLDAVTTRSSATAADRSTPVFLVEEPESFLHPSAQAEFGQVLNILAEELKIQIIATTHSPYMLNQTDPSANVLLERKLNRKLLRETNVIQTSGKNWMLPFAENLGVIPQEFEGWQGVFQAHSTNVILVEGEIDKAYFEAIRDHYSTFWSFPQNIEIVSYGGKDALKNTPILKFMISKFQKVFVTFDLDAESEVKPALERIGLIKDTDFCAVGIATAGCDCIEGLLPPEIKSKVFAEKHDLVSALSSQDTKARNSAKSKLKTELLSCFIATKPDAKELSDFRKLFALISKFFR